MLPWRAGRGGPEWEQTTADRWQSLRRWLVRALKIGALAAAVGGVVYWLKFAPVAVSVHQAERGDIVSEVMGTGTLEAHYKSTISPKISGRLQAVLADQGDRVEAGKVLFKLDDADLRQQVEMAQATVAGRRRHSSAWRRIGRRPLRS